MSNAAHMTIVRESVRFVIYVARRYESDNASRMAEAGASARRARDLSLQTVLEP